MKYIQTVFLEAAGREAPAWAGASVEVAVGVAVGVSLGKTTAVSVAVGSGVRVGSGVSVGGIGVGTAVSVGGMGVLVDGIAVGVRVGSLTVVVQPAIKTANIRQPSIKIFRFLIEGLNLCIAGRKVLVYSRFSRGFRDHYYIADVVGADQAQLYNKSQ